MNDNGHGHLSVRDCQFLIKYFDIDADNGLSYTEFMQMVLPCDNLNLRSECSQREPRGRYPSGRLPEHVEHHLAEFIVREVSLHLSIEMIKRNLN